MAETNIVESLSVKKEERDLELQKDIPRLHEEINQAMASYEDLRKKSPKAIVAMLNNVKNTIRIHKDGYDDLTRYTNNFLTDPSKHKPDHFSDEQWKKIVEGGDWKNMLEDLHKRLEGIVEPEDKRDEIWYWKSRYGLVKDDFSA